MTFIIPVSGEEKKELIAYIVNEFLNIWDICITFSLLLFHDYFLVHDCNQVLHQKYIEN